MPGAGLIQLIATGIQDSYLTGNPEISHFKYVYKRTSKFSIDSHKISYEGTIGFGKHLTFNLTGKGDLLKDIVLVVKLPQISKTHNWKYGGWTWVNGIGFGLIKELWLEIGGQKIIKYDGMWLDLWSELFWNNYDYYEKYRLVGKTSADVGTISIQNFFDMELYIPLYFWFSKEISAALPIIALQYHDVKLHIIFNDFDNVFCWGGSATAATKAQLFSTEPSDKNKFINREYPWNDTNFPADIKWPNQTDTEILDCYLIADYILLDKCERKKVASNKHFYLVEQIQKQEFNIETETTSLSLNNINEPVKELIWVCQSKNYVKNKNQLFNYYYRNMYKNIPAWTGYKFDPIKKMNLVINGENKMKDLENKYYNSYLPWKYHESAPKNLINIYPFCINPNDLQPSGTINFSYINDFQIQLEYKDMVGTDKQQENATSGLWPNVDTNDLLITVYAINYNLLEIDQGMGGIVFGGC